MSALHKAPLSAFTSLAVLLAAGNSRAQLDVALASPQHDFALTQLYISEPRKPSWRISAESEYCADGTYAQNLVPGFVQSYPSRLQLSSYLVVAREEGSTFLDGVSSEVGYALGEYGAVPLNPVVLLGVDSQGFEPSSLLGTLRLSRTFKADRVWAANVSFERKLGKHREREYLLVNRLRKEYGKLAVGAEFKGGYTTTNEPGPGSYFDALIGPSVAWSITPSCLIQVNSLLGLSGSSPRNETNFLLVINPAIASDINI